MTNVLRYTALGALFIIPFLPLYVDGSLFFPFISSKGFAFRILVEIAVAAWVLLALYDERYRPKWSWTLLIFSALVAWMFLADLLGANPQKAFWSNFERMDGWVALIHTFLFFVVAGAFLSAEKRWRAWWLTVLAASVIVTFHGILQLVCGGQACAQSFPIHQGGVRVDANLGNAAYLAAYLLFTIAIAVWQAIVSKGFLRYSLAALAVLQVVILFYTATRGAILALVVAIAAGALLWLLQAGKQGTRIGVSILVGLLVVVGGFLLVKDTSFVRNDPTLTRIASISLEAAETRFTLWNMALQGAMERPITGWGHEGYLHVFSKYFEPSLYAQEPWFDRAHSVYFDWLIAGGIPAFILFVALLITGVVSLYRSSLPKEEKILLIVALVAYAFQALFVFDNLFTYVFLAALLAIAHDVSGKPIEALKGTAPGDPTAISVAAPLVVGAVLISTLWIVNINNILAGKALIAAAVSREVPTAVGHFRSALGHQSFATQEIREQLITFASKVAREPAIPLETKQEVFGYALTEMEKQIAAVPTDPRVLLLYAQGLETAGDYPKALAVIEQAEALAPQKQLLLLQKGIVQWRGEDAAGAHETFERAYALDTSFVEAAIYAAVGRIITQDAAGADALLLESFGTTTVDHNLLRLAYYDSRSFPRLVQSAELHMRNNPTDPMARFQLAQAYVEAGRLSEARVLIDDTVREFPEQASFAATLLRSLQLK